jgi:hypothetical protein
MQDNYMESKRRRIRRAAIRYGSPALGALAGYGAGKTSKSKAIGSVLGAGLGEFAGRTATRALDKRDLRKAGFNPHKSSMILGSRYAPEGSYIKFNTGKVYRYGDVTKEELRQLADADSVGAHFNRNLKKRKYERLGKS